ncbi:MAG TPA: hypothetical protein PLM37_10425 [Elusimicrobiota bacterium]|nr:hypothetical protein [Elusimicrobiota bacterium]HMZ27720.1 hypothetical protein [Elusimicrobiota bacterium]HNG44169.1 hypothetical protein [Elusimicrobiota bacterium]
MTEKKKAVETAEPAVNPDAPLSQLLLDCTKEKYRLVSLATRWAQEVKVRDQSTLQPQELLDVALREIMLKKVTLEAIEKLPPPPKVEKKDIEFTLPTLSLKDVPDEPADKAVEKE